MRPYKLLAEIVELLFQLLCFEILQLGRQCLVFFKEEQYSQVLRLLDVLHAHILSSEWLEAFARLMTFIRS